MSLIAKLEAVIYAADEPVTLAQLAALFASDALEWKAAQRAALAAGSDNPPRVDTEPLPLNGEFDYLPASQAGADSLAEEQAQAADPVAPSPEAGAASGPAAAEDENPPAAVEDSENPEPSPEPNPESSPASAAETAPAGEAADDAEARRLARLRDREVRLILRQLLDELIASSASDSRGIEIREIAGGYRMATKPECHDTVRAFVKSLKQPLKLSLPALETLAVVAYKQPVTAPEVNEIRGVDSSAVFGSLLARKLIATAGRKPVIGRPILYKTTREFLLRFGLKDVSELPSMEEFEKMAVAELDEPDLEAEGESAPEIREDLRLELDETAGEEPHHEPPQPPH
jgi:segregation and condensation protein B